MSEILPCQGQAFSIASSVDDPVFDIPGLPINDNPVRLVVGKELPDTDMLEELPALFAEKLKRPLQGRKFEDGVRLLTTAEEMIEECEDYSLKVQRLELQQKFDAWLQDMGNGQEINLAQIQTYLEAATSEVSLHFVLLSNVRGRLSKEPGNEVLLRVIDRALVQTLDKQQPQIVQGLAIGPVAYAAQEQGVGSISSLCTFYRHTVKNFPSLQGAWKSIEEQFGSMKLEDVTKFMMRALAADLEIQRVGKGNNKLVCLMNDLSKLQALKNLYQQITELLRVVVEGRGMHGVRAF